MVQMIIDSREYLHRYPYALSGCTGIVSEFYKVGARVRYQLVQWVALNSLAGSRDLWAGSSVAGSRSATPFEPVMR